MKNILLIATLFISVAAYSQRSLNIELGLNLSSLNYRGEGHEFRQFIRTQGISLTGGVVLSNNLYASLSATRGKSNFSSRIPLSNGISQNLSASLGYVIPIYSGIIEFLPLVHFGKNEVKAKYYPAPFRRTITPPEFTFASSSYNGGLGIEFRYNFNDYSSFRVIGKLFNYVEKPHYDYIIEVENLKVKSSFIALGFLGRAPFTKIKSYLSNK